MPPEPMTDERPNPATALAEIDRLRADAAALSLAATEVNDRYIGGSPLKGRLGDAIESLAKANTPSLCALARVPAPEVSR